MAARILGYYDYNGEEELPCLHCGWRGSGREASTEHHAELFDVSCPQCGTTLLIVSYPTAQETEEAAARSNEGALRDLSLLHEHQEFLRIFERNRLKSVDQLPNLESDALNLVWDKEGEETVIKDGDHTVWNEPALYEGWSRFNDVKNILKQKYGSRFRSLRPTQRSEMYLYGDDLSAPKKISFE